MWIGTSIVSIWRFVAADVLDGDGFISDSLMQGLRRAGAFHSSPDFVQVPGLRPVLTTYGSEKITERLAPLEMAKERAYVVCVGEINNRYLLKRLVDDGIDFELPFHAAGIDSLSSLEPRQTLTSQQMMRVLLEEFQPLIRGLAILKNAGMTTLFLHSVPPPAVDDDDALRVLRHPSPGQLRYKLAMLVNHIYEAICREIGIGFINMWPQVTVDNLLDQRFYLDGLHLNAEHSKLSVTEAHRQLREMARK